MNHRQGEIYSLLFVPDICVFWLMICPVTLKEYRYNKSTERTFDNIVKEENERRVSWNGGVGYGNS